MSFFVTGRQQESQDAKNFHLTNVSPSCILAIKFKQVHAVNERKSEVRSLREPVDGENRCDVSVIYHS